MKFLDLCPDNRLARFQKRFRQIEESGIYLFGAQLAELEQTFPPSVGFKYGIAVKNATDALTMLLSELLRKNPDKTVICPNFTAYPTAVAIKNNTDKIYYVDVDESLTIDVNKLPDIEDAIVVAVNLFGNNANLPALRRYCNVNNSILIEDCAQSTGSEVLPRVSDFAVYSFYPTKPLGSMGDGGMICFNEEKLVEIFKTMRFYGQEGDKIAGFGVNSRMDEWQCAVVLEKMSDYRLQNTKRQWIARQYELLMDGFNVKPSNCIKVHTNCVYHQFPVLYRNRTKALAELKKRGIPYLIHYPWHIPDMPVLRGIHNKVGFRVNDRIVSLPAHPHLTVNEMMIINKFWIENDNT